jgi:hypothetical protein
LKSLKKKNRPLRKKKSLEEKSEEEIWTKAQEQKMIPQRDQDLYGWAVQTAQLLKDRKMNEVNFDEIVEELESLGRSDEYELINRLSLVMAHLLKWQFQPNMRGHSWVYTIEEQREQAKIHLRKNPSLKGKRDEILTDSYSIATKKAARETGLNKKDFPQECPYTFEQLMDETFYPE